MGLGASKPASRSPRNRNAHAYVIKASRTSCRYNSNAGTWTCNTMKLDSPNALSNANNANSNTNSNTNLNTKPKTKPKTKKKKKRTTRRKQ